MSDILSQAEIEALLNSLGGGDGGAAQPANPAQQQGPGSVDLLAGLRTPDKITGRKAVAYEVYDFRRPDKFSKDQLRTLQMLHETFARLAASQLSAYLRTPVAMDLISIEQVPFEEYLRSIESSVFSIMSISPLTGQAVLEIEFDLVFTTIDRMLGGPGKGIARNVLTDIERPLVRQVIDRLFQAMKGAWEQIIIINPTLESIETSAQFVQIAPSTDIVVTMLFEVKVGAQRHALSLCIPYLVLKPIAQKLSAQKWFTTGNKKQSNTHKRHLSHQLARTKVPCSVRLGGARVDFEQFRNLKAGDILKLDQATEKDLTMQVGAISKLTGRAGISGRRITFTVTGKVPEF